MAAAGAFQHELHQLVAHHDAVALKFALQLCLALYDVLIALFFLEPCADLIACFACTHDGKPVAVRAATDLLRRQNLNDLARFHLVIERHDLLVNLCTNHAVADGGMNGIRKIDNRRAHRQVDNVAFRGEDEHLFRRKIGLDGAHKVSDIFTFGLVIEHVADPLQATLQRVGLFVAARHAELIFPVRRDAVFCRVVHFPRANLHLERDALFADDRRVQGLVHVLLRRGNVVLKAVRQRGEHIMDDTEHIIAIVDGIDDYAQGEHVVNFVKALTLNEHLAINAVDAFYAPFNIYARDKRLHTTADHFFRCLNKLLALCAARLKVIFNLLIRHRIKVL